MWNPLTSFRSTSARSHSSKPRKNRRGKKRAQRRGLRLENLEARQMLAADGADDLMALSDEFDDAASISQWQRVNEVEGWNADQLDHWDVDGQQPGSMTMIPETVVWYQDWRGPMAFQEVTGDFVFTTEVTISDRDDIGNDDPDNVPGEGQFSLGGVMIRTPREISQPSDWAPGSMADDGTNNGENYVFLSLGYGNGANQFSLEVKTTRNSDSQLELTPLGANASTATVQIAKIGDSLIALYRLPGQDWQVHRRYSRPDMPETMQVGLVTYTDWEKANDFDPFYHNGHVLNGDFDPTPETPFNPDLNASFDYARYVRPDVPPALQGLDLSVAGSDLELLSFLGDNANTPADPPVDPPPSDDLPEIPDQTVIHDQALDILLAESHNGESISYLAEVIGDLAYQLDQEHNLYTGGDYYQNWGGQNERWIQGDGGWYYLLPGGDFHQWNGDFATSNLLGQLGAAAYDDPALVHDAQPAATLSLESNVLVVTPRAGFVGELQLQVDLSTASQSETQLVTVDVTNIAPEITPIADQVMPATQDSLAIDFMVSDSDGDALTHEVIVIQSEEYQLDEEYQFANSSDYYEDWGGQNERWIRDSEGGWFYLLPAGELHEWGGSFEGSPLVADLSPQVYQDPMLLTDAQAVAVEAEIVAGQIVVDPAEGFAGDVAIVLSSSDGIAVSQDEFVVSVNNSAPLIADIADQQMAAGQLDLDVLLDITDPDGDALQIEAVILDPAYDLDQIHGFWSNGDYADNWGGQNERWIQDANNDWHYLLPGGELHRWEGSFEASTLLANLGAEYYQDPELLTDAQPVAATASILGNVLTIEREASLLGLFTIRVMASDGIASSQTTFQVQMS